MDNIGVNFLSFYKQDAYERNCLMDPLLYRVVKILGKHQQKMAEEFQPACRKIVLEVREALHYQFRFIKSVPKLNKQTQRIELHYFTINNGLKMSKLKCGSFIFLFKNVKKKNLFLDTYFFRLRF